MEHYQVTRPAILKSASLTAVQKEQEEQLAFASATGVDRDARNQGAIKVLKAVLHIVKPMEEVGGVSILDALKVLRGGQTTVLHMVVGSGAGIHQDVLKQQGASQAFASNMVEGKGAR